MSCPQTPGLKWKIEDNRGVCAQTADGWVDWEYPGDNAQKSLGYYLDSWYNAGWISPATPGSQEGAKNVAPGGKAYKGYTDSLNFINKYKAKK